jgi:hypothetical protein
MEFFPFVSLIDLMMHMCHCLQTQKTPVSATMNMLFFVASLDLYLYFTNKTFPSSYFPHPKKLMTFQTSLHAHLTAGMKVLKLHMPTIKILEQT